MANDIIDREKKSAILLSLCELTMYGLICSFVKGASWCYGGEQEKTVGEETVLEFRSASALYDDSKSLALACDVSPYGVGAPLSHQLVELRNADFLYLYIGPCLLEKRDIRCWTRKP